MSLSGSRFNSDYHNYQNNPWLRKTTLPGSHFHDGYILATIIFTAIFIVALLAIGIWAVTIADNLLLSAIFGSLYYCFLHPDGPDNAKRGLKGAIYWGHLTFCGVLGALYIMFLGHGINNVVPIIGNDGAFESYTAAYDGVPTMNKVQVAFEALYFMATVEILAATAYLIATARKRDLTTKLGISIMSLIGAPLLIRRVFILAFPAAFNLSLDTYLTADEYIAESIIEGITLVLTYAGVVLAFKQLGELPWKLWDGHHQQAQIPITGYDNPQAQSPPQMGRLYEPNRYQTPYQNGPTSPYQIGQATPYENHAPTQPLRPVTMGHNY